MKLEDIAVATMTWVRDRHEDALLRAALARLARTGLPLFVCDGGSGVDFLAFLGALPNAKVCPAQGQGLWPQVRASVAAAAASGKRCILYTEPDKHDFFERALASFILEAPDESDTGAVLASRDPETYATFPAFQRYTESVINRCCAEVIGANIDYSYGPFLFTSRAAPYLRHAPEDAGWGWRQFAFGIVRRLELRVLNLDCGVACPAGELAEDAKVKRYRMRQMTESVNGLLASAGVPLKPAG